MLHAKRAVLTLAVLWLAGWLGWGAMNGMEDRWLAVGLAMLLAYGGCGWLSYRGGRARWIALGASALLTVAVAFVTFAHLGLVAGGIAVMAGCALRPS